MRFKAFHVFIIYTLAEMLAFTFFMPYIYSLEVSNLSLLLYFIFAYVSAITLIALSKRIEPKRFIMIAFFLRILVAISMVFFASNITVPIIGIISGTTFYFFWVPLNISYFISNSNKHATESWKYSFAAPIIGIMIPSLSGIVSSYFGIQSLFLAAIPLYLLGIFVASRTEWKSIDYNLKDSLKKFSGLRTLSFIDGFWQPAFFIGIPLVTANYLKSSLKFGGFYSYLGIVSTMAAFVMVTYSDKYKKRKLFVYVVPFLLALASIAIAFHNSFIQWTILAGIAYFLHPMAVTFFLAMLLDTKSIEIIPESMIAREYILNLGRAFGTIVLILFSLYGNILHGFIILGSAMLISPFLIKLKRIYAFEAGNVQN